MKSYETARREFVPSDAIIVRPKLGTAEVFLYNDAKGRPCVRAFKGRRKRPDIFCWYRCEQDREYRVRSFLADVQKEFERKEALRQKRSQPHTLKIDDILATSWGYDQTNVDFFKVVKLVGKSSVELVRIGWKEALNSPNASLDMQGTKLPLPDIVQTKPCRFRVDMGSGDPSIKIGHSQYARPWNGKPMFYSTYA